LDHFLGCDDGTTYQETHLYDLELLSTFASILYERLSMERKADKVRENISKRWDYEIGLCYSMLARESMIDLKKLKQFFTRMKQPLTDEDVSGLLTKVPERQYHSMAPMPSLIWISSVL
jgi:hypothetical protein